MDTLCKYFLHVSSWGVDSGQFQVTLKVVHLPSGLGALMRSAQLEVEVIAWECPVCAAYLCVTVALNDYSKWIVKHKQKLLTTACKICDLTFKIIINPSYNYIFLCKVLHYCSL